METGPHERAFHECIHDLRSPLAAIQAHADLLIDGILGPLSEDQRDAVSTVLSGVDRMEDLLEGFSRRLTRETGADPPGSGSRGGTG